MDHDGGELGWRALVVYVVRSVLLYAYVPPALVGAVLVKAVRPGTSARQVVRYVDARVTVALLRVLGIRRPRPVFGELNHRVSFGDFAF